MTTSRRRRCLLWRYLRLPDRGSPNHGVISTRKLLVIDGANVLYRAFFAIASLNAPDGHPTNALFGFIRILRQLRQQWMPTHWVVVFDGGLPARRTDILPSYKAQRPHMPDDLRRQLEPVNDYLARACIASVRMEAQEADDVIATVAVHAGEDCEVLVATSDKDAFQLISPAISVVPPVQTGQRMGRQEVFDKCGAYPEQIADWLALTGDSVDNIPGIPGLGPKTAAKLLAEFGTLANIMTRLDAVKPDRIREALRANIDVLPRNAELVRLDRELPVKIDWEAWVVKPEQFDRLSSFYERWGFKSMARDLREPELLL